MTEKSKPDVYVTLDKLVRLQFDAKGISFLPKQPVDSLLSGRHTSRLRGRGLLFEELRIYRPGDDIRTMDWRATARLKKPHVRVYSEERERPVLLVVDQRVGMFFGSQRATKAVAAAKLAALVAWRSLVVGDRIGAILFDDQEMIRLKPHRSRSNVLKICNQICRLNQRLSSSTTSNPSMLNRSLQHAVRIAKHDYLVILVTDYQGDDETTKQLVTSLAAKNDVLAALVYDPLGMAIHTKVPLSATDGKQNMQIGSDRKTADHFEQAFRNRCQEIRQQLQSIRVPILPICTHDPVVNQVRSALGGGK